MMRALVVSPTQMHAKLLCRNIDKRVVERLDMHAGALAKLLQTQIRKLDMSAHAEVGAVNLQDEPRFGHGFVFVTHCLSYRVKVGLVILVIVVAEEQRDYSR